MASKLKLLLLLAGSAFISSHAARTSLDKVQTEIHDAATAHPPRDTKVIPVTEVKSPEDLGLKDLPKNEDRTKKQRTNQVDKEAVKPTDSKVDQQGDNKADDKKVVDDKTVVDDNKVDQQTNDNVDKDADDDEEFEFIPIVLLRGNHGGLYVFQPFQHAENEPTVTDEDLAALTPKSGQKREEDDADDHDEEDSSSSPDEDSSSSSSSPDEDSSSSSSSSSPDGEEEEEKKEKKEESVEETKPPAPPAPPAPPVPNPTPTPSEEQIKPIKPAEPAGRVKPEEPAVPPPV